MKFLLDNRNRFFLLLVVLTLGLGAGLLMIKVDFSFESFYPKDDPEFQYYTQYEKYFPNADNTILIALGNGPAGATPQEEIFNRAFLTRADSLFRDLGTLPHVDSVVNPVQMVTIRRSGLGVKTKKVFDLESELLRENARKWVETDTFVSRAFVSEDSKFLAAYLQVDTTILDSSARDILTNSVIDKVEATGYEYVVSGVPTVRTQYVEKTTFELLFFTAISILILIAFLTFTYRSVWGVVIPLIGVIGALVWCMGTIGWAGKPMDLLSGLLPPILFVVGMADIIHLVTRYSQELRNGLPPLKAMKATLDEIGVAILLTSVTTAIGFLSLLVSRIPPIREFGFFIALGVLFAYVISIVLVPFFLLKIDPKKIIRSKGLSNFRVWDRMLSWIYLVTKRFPGRVALTFVGIIAFSIFGMSQISFNAFLLEDLRPSDPIRKSMDFFEENFYGFRQFEMAIEMKEGHKVTDLDVLQDLEKMENKLHTQSRFSPFISPVTLVKRTHLVYHSNREGYYRLPETQEKVDKLLDFVIIAGGAQALDLVMTEDRTYARLNARMGDVGTDSMAIVYADFDAFAAENIDSEKFEYRFTGMSFLTERNVQYLRDSLLFGLLLAFGLIGILMGFLFRSWKMVLIAMVPNLVPLLFTAGMMGILGIAMKSSTSIVFVIAFGIAVDDTIHFLSRLRVELTAGRDLQTAIRNTVTGTGKALLMTTLILLSGFLILLASDFGGTYIIGLFTGLTLVMALASDLFLMPVLIRWIKPGIGGKKAKLKEEPVKEPVLQ